MINIDKDKATVKLTLAEYDALVADKEEMYADLKRANIEFHEVKEKYEEGLTQIVTIYPNSYGYGYAERVVYKTTNQVLKAWSDNFITSEIKELQEKLEKAEKSLEKLKRYTEDTSVWEFIKMKRSKLWN